MVAKKKWGPLVVIAFLAVALMLAVTWAFNKPSIFVHVAEPPRQQQQEQEIPKPIPITADAILPIIQNRDRRVDADTLYPPLSREGNLPLDTFRPVGYLVSSEDSHDVWKLYARERRRGGISDFYAVHSDKTRDLKVTLNDEVVESRPRLRDIYDLPQTLRVKHPMFEDHSYKVVEMQRADWADMPNYF